MLSTIKVTNRLKVEVPKTSVDECSIVFLLSIVFILVGIVIRHYEQNS